MELVVASRHHLCDFFSALDVSGREHLVVIVKATWTLPVTRSRPRPIAPQPLAVTDEYYGAPGESAMRYGADYVRFKPRCDVLFDACAHAPAGRPVRYLDVLARIGNWQKAIQVAGPRQWQQGLLGLAPGRPEPFTRMPLHYGHAFGGAREYVQGGQKLSEALLSNPVGKGWGGRHTSHTLAAQPMPNLEYPKDPVRSPDGRHLPAALSAVGRHWLPRSQYAGTCDETWRREVAPFLPEDFDERFFLCAPPDQQIDTPQGGEEVSLGNLLADAPVLNFRLPPLSGMQVRILRKDYSAETLAAPVDTLFFETEQKRFSAIWRASTPIRRRIQEFDTIAVGAVDPRWWQARSLGVASGGCVGCSSREVAT
ncbi:MAG: DUF2169 domain-containing protein [Azoarcus sp.]|jgi:hypothetical protein|nr:DUF2169 domain-containing protein [Azoarcus sp.]